MKDKMTPQCCIDDMEELLQQLNDFETQLQQAQRLNAPAFRQEYAMFSKYLKWRLEDLHRSMRQDLSAQIKSLG
jgi:putative hemolysin